MRNARSFFTINFILFYLFIFRKVTEVQFLFVVK
jgi:hypothetical protein